MIPPDIWWAEAEGVKNFVKIVGSLEKIDKFAERI